MATPYVCPACGTSAADAAEFDRLDKQHEFFRKEGGVRAPAELRNSYDAALHKNRRRNECVSPLHSPPKIEAESEPVAATAEDIELAEKLASPKPARRRGGKSQPAPAPQPDEPTDEVQLQEQGDVSGVQGEEGQEKAAVPDEEAEVLTPAE